MFGAYAKYDEIPQTMSCRVQFDSNNVSDPDGLIDTAGVVNTAASGTTSGLNYEGVGLLSVTLKGSYRRIKASVIVHAATADLSVRVYQVDDVSDAGVRADPPKVYIMTTTTSTGAVLDTNNVRYILDLELSP